MAVYERTYRTYRGPVTPQWTRFLVLPRYGFKRVFASKLTLAYFVACLLPSVVALALIYISHNLAILRKIGLEVDALDIATPGFFERFLAFQGVGMGFLLVLFTAPGLISGDVSNNALPLYFSRPFTRWEYVLGKITILWVLLSAISWVPGLLSFLLQSYLAGGGWMWENINIGIGIFVGSWVWIVSISLVALAISASVKRKTTAMIYLFAIAILLPGFGAILALQFGLWWGMLLNLTHCVNAVWSSLFGTQPPQPETPVAAAVLAVVAFCGVSLIVLQRKVRAYEVVR